jgi:glycine cleavage system aminomethyltransferase T
LHPWHAAHGARFVERGGWALAADYGSVAKEVAAARDGVGLADVSAFAKTSLLGAGVPGLAAELLGVGAVSRPRAVAALDATVPVLACRLALDQLLLLSSETVDRLAERLGSLMAGKAVVRSDVTAAYAGFALVGPIVEDVLRRLTGFDVSPAGLPLATCAETSLAGVHTLLVRPPATPLPSLRVYVGWDVAEYLWERLLQAGESAGITPLGLEAWHSLARPE